MFNKYENNYKYYIIFFFLCTCFYVNIQINHVIIIAWLCKPFVNYVIIFYLMLVCLGFDYKILIIMGFQPVSKPVSNKSNLQTTLLRVDTNNKLNIFASLLIYSNIFVLINYCRQMVSFFNTKIKKIFF